MYFQCKQNHKTQQPPQPSQPTNQPTNHAIPTNQPTQPTSHATTRSLAPTIFSTCRPSHPHIRWPYRTPCYIIPTYHIISYHTMSYHIVSYRHIISACNVTISYHITVSDHHRYHIIAYDLSCPPHRSIPYKFISCHSISCPHDTSPYHINMPYYFIMSYQHIIPSYHTIADSGVCLGRLRGDGASSCQSSCWRQAFMVAERRLEVLRRGGTLSCTSSR